LGVGGGLSSAPVILYPSEAQSHRLFVSSTSSSSFFCFSKDLF
jgi:hypothetical protein